MKLQLMTIITLKTVTPPKMTQFTTVQLKKKYNLFGSNTCKQVHWKMKKKKFPLYSLPVQKDPLLHCEES